MRLSSVFKSLAVTGLVAFAAAASAQKTQLLVYTALETDQLKAYQEPGSVTRMSPKGKWHCHGSPGFHLFVLETEFVVCGLQHPDFSAWRSWQTQNGTASPLRSAVQAHRSLRVTSACLC